MTDPTLTSAPAGAPIEVNATPETAQWEAAVRQAILVLSGVATALGYTQIAGKISALLMVAGPIAGLIVFILGQIHTRRAEQKQIVMANALPDSVARVKAS
jgi:hypothetical protein